LPDAKAPATAAAPAVGPVAQCRCPRCAYPLTGLPGVPEDPYGAFGLEVRCPECALIVPAGAHCLTGGVSPSVVEPGGLRNIAWVLVPGFVLIGAVQFAMLLLPGLLGAGGPGFSLWNMGTGSMGAALGVLGGMVGTSVGFWAVWRHWRPAGGAGRDAERAGARLRRAMVVPGGIHLWTGEPSAEATPRSLAGGDVRDVRGRRHIPLFRRKGAADVGAIDFVTPIMLWSLNDSKAAWNTTDGQPSGTVWMLMPAGAHPQTVARTLERTLRAPPHAPALGVAVTQAAAMPAVTVGGDPNRYAVPPAVTAATAGDPPKCPRCSHLLGDVPDGPWWEPLPRDVRCPECGLLAPEGAVVLTGWRHAGQAMRSGPSRRRGWMIALLITVFVALVGGAVLAMAVSRSVILFMVLQMTAVFMLPAGLMLIARRGNPPIPRPRARFQAGTETWIVERGRLRIVPRGKRASFQAGTGREVEIPARGVGSFTFGRLFASDNSIPVMTDRLVARGTSPALGLGGERFLELPIPAEVDPEDVVAAVRSALNAPPR
jgi:hypothetical protein